MVIEQLARHYRIGALTNGNADIYKTDAGDYFDFAFLAEDVGASKPALALFRAAIERAGVAAAAIAHVGDSPAHDVAGAREAGMKTVWFNPGAEPWDPAQGARPDATVRQLTELPSALAAL